MTLGTPPTLDDVAREARVSRSTASRAINGGERVSPEAQAAVDDAVARLGYTPNRAARSLVTRRTDSIALVMPEPDTLMLTDPFLAGVLRGVTDGIAGTDLQLVLLLNRLDEAPGRIARYLGSGHVDGAIIASAHERHQLEDALTRTRLPAVFVGRPFGDVSGHHFVDVDNIAGSRLATQRLVDRGCRRIGTVTGPQDMSAGIDRLRGWRETLEAAGLPTDAVVTGDFTAVGGADAAARLLDAHPDLDGVFAASDLMAEGVLRVLHSRGKRVPDDVALVGFDDLGIAQHTNPRLTTVHNPVVATTMAATATLLGLLAGAPVPTEPQIFAPYLVEGESA
ncbi:transcriptional regulator, LacI family [Xylanimonas cellulosilytica DSM 15894]|uniref:Transcriptional regulator, LacI family n=1 Tax=Xylanimonas cellulosilytica (strain DSM 15894 / JCM 12276 / CECT 5975 / KCTC 9989 / LMG 20990 / NBRC 107835 / XIL07) TaxID=446471 RepID=D1BX61_XYLCX|nr:LacI family DNA-binding transcriptional regulator [Xylanimonas cellulosilytica]ACZ31629.1 transcriptional regulator, LacI family [Xylanimonas cellulosilytica DSM 15894]